MENMSTPVTFEKDPPRNLRPMQRGRGKLTDRQTQVLNLIREGIRTKGYAPTMRELGAAMGIRSTNGIADHLRFIERKGYIARDGYKSRAIRVLDPDGEAGVADALPPSGTAPPTRPTIPLYSGFAAIGVPKIGEPIRQISPPHGVRADLAMLVRSDALSNLGIADGTLLYVAKPTTPAPGAIVVVRTGDEMIVRVFQVEGTMIRLETRGADTASTPPLYLRTSDLHASLIGVVVAMWREIGETT